MFSHTHKGKEQKIVKNEGEEKGNEKNSQGKWGNNRTKKISTVGPASRTGDTGPGVSECPWARHPKTECPERCGGSNAGQE